MDFSSTIAGGSGGNSLIPFSHYQLFAGNPYGPGNVDAQGGDASFNFPRGVVSDNLGNVYVVDSNNQTIRKVTPAGNISY